MGIHLSSILASDDDTIKVIGVVVFLIIWGIGAMASAAKKAQEASRRKQMQNRSARPATAIALPPVQRMPAAVRPRQVAINRPAAKRAAPPPLPQSTRSAAKPAAFAAAPLPPFDSTVQRTPARPAPIRPRPATARSARTPITGWLNAGTVRSQFILAEILQPPLAFRKKRNF
jgi:hypothetical protein